MSKKIKISDLRGLTSILTDATVNVTDLVEDMHKRIVHPPFMISTPIQHLITGISGLVYNNVRWVTRLVGGGLEKGLAQFNPQSGLGVSYDKKENLLAVLNGVVGDYLQRNNNPLALPMKFKYQGKTIAIDGEGTQKANPKVNGKILLMVHGLCMNDAGWDRNDHNHGTQLAEVLNLTPVYLQYNSGLHISDNGQNLNEFLGKMLNTWPVPVEELTIVAHSMGGLVSRSAVHYAQQENNTWTKHLKHMVFLGTPHHGAPLERVGHYVDRLLELIPYVKPFARLGKMRSSGITDLRFGNLVETDWKGQDRFENRKDERAHVALPEGVNCYAIAAIKGKKAGGLKDQLIGDGLVQLESALGKQKN